MKNIKDVIDSGLCLGCGICLANGNINGLTYHKSRGYFIPDLKDLNEINTTENDYDVCPGKGYDIIADAKGLFDEVNYNLEIGYYREFYAAHSNDEKILENASSGGLITELLLYVLKNKIVDLVVVTKFEYNENGVRTKTILTDKPEEILESQGSKYCPVNIDEALIEIKTTSKRVAVVGTPCHIAGIRELQKQNEFKNIVLTITNLCGGFYSYNNISKLTKYFNISTKDVEYFRFRGGGQPGSLKIRTSEKKSVITPYPRYVGFTGYSKHLRCHLCVDATGELADISFGDLWLEKYLKSGNPWSIVIIRSLIAEQVMNKILAEKLISVDKISLDDIIQSQKSNLTSKKVRQKARMRLYRFLGYSIPSFDGSYYDRYSSMKTEIVVFVKHKILYLLEILNMYKTVWKIFK